MNKYLSWTVVILWMALIFYLSHQPASESSELSTGITDILLSLFPFVNLDAEHLGFFIRKGAHFFAYFILGWLLMLAFRVKAPKPYKKLTLAFLICVAYAISDEIHQLYVPGRSGEVRDVLIDSAGAMCGILLYLLFARKSSLFRRKTQ